jgi:hypothetical protein
VGCDEQGPPPLLSTGTGEPFVEWTEDDTYRYVESNGIPDHETGEFPNANNPNSISEQSHSYQMLLEPVESTEITPAGLFGMALNGVPFDPGTAEFWNRDPSSGWNYEALTGFLDLGADMNHAHVQPTGTYHYHGMPEGLLLNLTGGVPAVTIVAYAADGFPVVARYGYQDPDDAGSELILAESSYALKQGTRPDGPGGAYDGTFTADWEYVDGFGDLDECNGRFGVLPGYPNGIYHYYVTDDFPFVPRCFVADPDESFDRRPLPPLPPRF